jgi:hypothetical protein
LQGDDDVNRCASKNFLLFHTGSVIKLTKDS